MSKKRALEKALWYYSIPHTADGLLVGKIQEDKRESKGSDGTVFRVYNKTDGKLLGKYTVYSKTQFIKIIKQFEKVKWDKTSLNNVAKKIKAFIKKLGENYKLHWTEKGNQYGFVVITPFDRQYDSLQDVYVVRF